MSHNHFIELKIDATLSNNQNDHPVTVSRDHNMIAGETILISGRPGSNAGESGNPFVKTKMIAGNPKSIFAKINNTFAKIKNQIYSSGNRFSNLENIFFVPKNQFPVNILQGAVNKLKEDEGFFSEAVNILQESKGFSKFSGNKLQEAESILREAGNKLKEEESDLKILGKGTIFVETFRKFEIRGGDFLE